MFSVACNVFAAPDFSRDVMPLLSDTCFACHGPDANARKAKLRLDVEADAKQEVIVPGKSAESEIIARIFSKDADELMPPPESNLKLTAAKRRRSRNGSMRVPSGVSIGLMKPQPVAPPKVKLADWPRGNR